MYKIPEYSITQMDLDNKKQGETIENKVKRLIQNKEPIKDGVPIIFTERSHGVNPAYNVRTDRWEIAVDSLSKIEELKKAKNEKLMSSENVGEKVKTETKNETKPETGLPV